MKKMDIFKKGLISLMTAAMLLGNSAVPTLAAEPGEVFEEEFEEVAEEDADEEPVDGESSYDGYSYKISNGFVVITGYEGTEKDLVIPEKIEDMYVRELSEKAFYGKSDLQSVTLPRYLNYIGSSAFNNCTGLKELKIKCEELGNRSTYAYYSPFYNAGALDGFVVTAESGVTRIPSKLFATWEDSSKGVYCRVTKLVLADSVTEIDADAFRACCKLSEVEGGAGVTDIGDRAFRWTALTSFPDFTALEKIGESGFSGISTLKTVQFGLSMKTIGEKAFADDAKLEQVTLPKNLKSIKDRAFENCTGLKELTIKSEELGTTNNYAYYAPFYNAGSLDGFVVTAENGVTRIPRNLFSTWESKSDGVYCRITKLVLGDSVTEIQGAAFRRCYALEEVTLSAKISTIEDDAFNACDSLRKVYSSKPKTKIKIGDKNDPLLDAEWIVSSSGGGKDEPSTGDITVNGDKVASLKTAFKGMKDSNTDYVVELGSDVSGEKNLTIPKTAGSVTIKGNGHKISIVGTKITSGTKLILEDITFSAANKKGVKAKFSVNAKKGLVVNDGVGFDASAVTVKVGGDLELNADLNANNVSTTNLILNSDSRLNAAAGYKISVKNLLKGDGGEIELAEGFDKPIALNGSAEGRIVFCGAKQADGTQLIKANAKKLPAETLKAVFDVTDITENATDTYMYYLSSGKACIFGESISYNGENYALWKDVVAKMNIDKASEYVIELIGDVNVKGALKLPKKGYQSLTINGNEHTLTFTGNIKLTGNTVIKDTVLKKVDKKGRQQSGKVVKGKFTYEGPETF